MTAPETTDWVTQVLDRLDGLIDLVRSKTTSPIAFVARVLVYGLLAAVMGAVVDAPPGLNNRVTVIAHRGASADTPENTLPAVDLGADMLADFIEIDVRMTRDAELVAIHDITLARTTDVEIRYPDRAPWDVGDFTLDEIRTLDAGSWFGEEFAGTGVPTLQQVLAIVHGRAGLLLEVKRPALYPGIAKAIVAELDGAGWPRTDAQAGPLVVQSFDWAFMKAFKALAPEVPVGLLGCPQSQGQIAELSAWADQINPRHRRVADFVETVHQHQMVSWPYTVDAPRRMRELIALGIDGIITNRPNVLIGVLEENRQVDRAA